MSQIKKAGVLSYINLCITNVVGILITPFIIKMLGDNEYGLYSMIGAFVGYLTILDLGLNNSIIRFIAKYRAEKDEIKQANFIAVSLIIYLFIAIVISIAGFFMYINVEKLFTSLDTSEVDRAKWMILVLILNIIITLPGGAFTAICNGYEKFIFPRALNLVKYITRSILVVLILTQGANALGLVILDTALNILMIVTSIYFVLVRLKVKIKLLEFKKDFVLELFSYSLWIFLFGLVYQFQWRSGQIILGITIDTTVVAIYSIGVTLGLYFMTFGNVINGLILPKAVKSVISNKSTNNQLTDEMIKISRLSMILLFFIFGGFIVIGKEFVLLWVGKTYIEAWLVALLIMIAYIIPISQGYAHAILEAKSKMRFKALSSLIFSGIGVFIGGLLSNHYGLKGMIYGVFGGLMLLQIVVMFYYHYEIKLNMKKYLLNSLMPYIILCVGVTLLCNLSFEIIFSDSNSWLIFISKGIIYSIIFGLGMVILLSKNEKQFILRFIKK